MISIIISSRHSAQLEAVKINIGATIGCRHEVIGINNSDGKYGICHIYNEGSKRATFDIICFMHEDVLFETPDWGQRVIEHLADPDVGLIGLAGGDTKSWVPSSWASSIFPSEISIVQHFKDRSRTPERIIRTGYPDSNEIRKPVICLDGVWLCTRRDVLQSVAFDEKTFQGFHGYDIDFSLQVSFSYRVCVVFDICLHHFSEGSFNEEWLAAAIRLSDKWAGRLPVSVRKLEKRDFVHQHWTSMRLFLERILTLRQGRVAAVAQLLKYSRTRYFHLRHFLHFLKFIILYRRAH